MKKNIVTSIYRNITTKPVNAGGLESTTVAKELNCYYLGKKNRNNKNVEGEFYDISTSVLPNPWQLNVIYIQLSQPNFFGGVIDPDILLKSNYILNCYEAGSGCSIVFLANDPAIKPTNPFRVLASRGIEIPEEKIKSWDNLNSEATIYFQGKSISKFWGKDYDKFVYYPTFSKIFKNSLGNKIRGIVDVEPMFDIIYYGANRNNNRQKMVRNFIDDDYRSCVIGMKNLNFQKARHLRSQKHEKVMDYLNDSKVSLIFGDKEHDDNVITFRVYEAFASSAVAAIYLPFDPNKEIVRSNFLKEKIYFKTKEDLNRIKNYDFPTRIRIVAKQQEEFKRLIDV